MNNKLHRQADKVKTKPSEHKTQSLNTAEQVASINNRREQSRAKSKQSIITQYKTEGLHTQ